jgi:hypothetical protein
MYSIAKAAKTTSADGYATMVEKIGSVHVHISFGSEGILPL